jgi:flavin reductase (DIM6/NTAB) family NADH-FMN oxidoreductase RutF
MSLEAFDAVLQSLDAPMVVVTATAHNEHSGCLVGFHTQCSIDPRRWIVCLSKKNHTCGIAQHASALVLHMLRRDQRVLAELFGSETDDQVDKFEHCTWKSGLDGTRILARSDWIAGRIIERTDLGDHIGHILDIIDAGSDHAGSMTELGFQSVRDLEPGHQP